MQDKFVNLFTDFGFKKLFGEEPNKDLLISFLNTLLPEKHHIQDLQFTKNEYQGSSALDRKAIFDLSCTSSTGERFIVELQKAKQNYFKDRSVYYATFPIQEQAQRGDWDYKLAAVYTVGILDFVFDEDRREDDHEVVHFIQLKNQNGHVFYDKLTFIYLTLPHFQKARGELRTLQDKWFYIFRHLHELQEVPPELQEAIFLKLFAVANIAKFSSIERQVYEDSLKYYRDLKNVTDTAEQAGHEKGREEGREEGLKQGIEQGIRQVARNMLVAGIPLETVMQATGLNRMVLEGLV
jgi:predicted transposase/invertase (TIGR01784 family)